MRQRFQDLRSRLVVIALADDGMSTVEYAIGTLAAAAFGAILYAVVTGDSIVVILTNTIARALNTLAQLMNTESPRWRRLSRFSRW